MMRRFWLEAKMTHNIRSRYLQAGCKCPQIDHVFCMGARNLEAKGSWVW